MERCVPSKHLSPFALLSSSTVLGWPQRLSDNAPTPGQRCMDVFSQYLRTSWVRAITFRETLARSRQMCTDVTEAPTHTKNTHPKGAFHLVTALPSAPNVGSWRPMRRSLLQSFGSLCCVSNMKRPRTGTMQTKETQHCFVVPLTFKRLSAMT